ncbi:TNF receptor-associated factor 5-like [Corticium candelabrum]|uniref:TNF receptor-associated factor 5-like n=1 Tax=Corticium candelabrum TaxID=121492 RepID=UPI002E254646|nr:TNF receptor-associated factor 5-like [Corticium candelabrum]
MGNIYSATPNQCEHDADRESASFSDSDEDGETSRAHGGYDLQFTDESELGEDVDVHCTICHLVLRNPMLSRCGHHMCNNCLNLIAQGQTFCCPICRKSLNKSVDVFPDNALKRRLLDLHVKCKNWKEGCGWTGELRVVRKHARECGFVVQQCPRNCGQHLTRDQMASHLRNDCVHRLVRCEHCKEVVKFFQIESHNSVCLRYPVRCAFECGQSVPREEMEAHVDRQGTCSTVVLQCDCREVGCEFRGTRSKLEKHTRADVHKHVMLTVIEASKENERVRNLESNFTSTQCSLATTKENKKKIRSLESNLVSVQRSLTTIRQEVMEMKRFVYVWKIDSWYKESTQTYLGSGSFYTGRPGYKLYLRLYPNTGESHVGFYLHIEHGNYDTLLQWPFPYCFSVSVLEQRVDGNDITHRTIAPATSLASPGTFYGSRKFIQYKALLNGCYIKNDTLLIKLVVDMN